MLINIIMGQSDFLYDENVQSGKITPINITVFLNRLHNTH